MSGTKKDRLGKGLGALLGDYMDSTAGASDSLRLPVRSIVPNPKQPRRLFNEAELSDLAQSIEANGLLQPLVVRAAPGTIDRYELVVGERRWRAVRSLGWDDVPALVRDVDDDTLLILALVENLQREALNAIEEAQGYQVLSEDYGLSQSAIGRSVGKNRSTVANMLRLLRLPPSVRALLEDGSLTPGHARPLLALEDPVRISELARMAVAGGWSVREVERKVHPSVGGAKKRVRPEPNPVVAALEEELRAALATKVSIRANRKGTRGTIEVPFHNTEEFERVFEAITGKEASEIAG
jgi:ParB family transcriptional regulator, chromosome partitioning protein